MEMQRRKDQKQTGILAGADLSTAVRSEREVANYYDQMTNDMMQIADAGITMFTNSMIADAKENGEIAGKEGAKRTSRPATKEDIGKVDANGVPIKKEGQEVVEAASGYEKESQIFKWNRTFNNAAFSSFKTSTNAQSSGLAKNVAKDANGDINKYKTIMREMKTQALAAVEDPRQKTHVEAAYDSAYAKNLGTVTATGKKQQIKLAKESWTFGREEFKENLAIKDAYIERAKAKANDPSLSEEQQRAWGDKLKTLEKEREDMINNRLLKDSETGLNLGAYTYKQVVADTRDDVVAARVEAINYTLRNTPEGERYKKIKQLTDIPDPTLTLTEQMKVRQELYKKLSADNSAYSDMESRKKLELEVSKKQSNSEIRQSLINLHTPDYYKELTENEYTSAYETIEKRIQDDFIMGYLTREEKDYYMNVLRNGDPVKEDDVGVYRNFRTNLETTSYEDIEINPYLTLATKKKLIDEKNKLVAEGETWMKPAAYKEGKETIMKAYGFTEAMMFEVVKGKKQQEMNQEMIVMLEDYKELVRAASKDGKIPNHFEISRKLLKEARANENSHIYKSNQVKGVTEVSYEEVQKQATNLGISVSEHIKSLEARPSTTYVGEKDEGKSGSSTNTESGSSTNTESGNGWKPKNELPDYK